MNNEPLDMTPADMASALADFEYHNATMLEILEVARGALEGQWLGRAVTSPTNIEKAYFAMIGGRNQ